MAKKRRKVTEGLWKRKRATANLDMLEAIFGISRAGVKLALFRKGVKASSTEDVAIYIVQRFENVRKKR